MSTTTSSKFFPSQGSTNLLVVAMMVMVSTPAGVQARIGGGVRDKANKIPRHLPPVTTCFFNPNTDLNVPNTEPITLGNADGSFTCGRGANSPSCEDGEFRYCNKVICEKTGSCDNVKVLGTEDTTTVVECSGKDSCLGLQTEYVDEVKCTGKDSCLGSENLGLLGPVECSGKGSCAESLFAVQSSDQEGVSVTCSGKDSCEGSDIQIPGFVDCSGKNACLDASINTPSSVILPSVRDSFFPIDIIYADCVEMTSPSDGCTYRAFYAPRDTPDPVDCFTIAQQSCPTV
uniref:SUEL-type lectin domain-containing protein n=1 Tax=Entomoneis paludosa TaxID=265537 RepID=A0A6U2YBN3_9STRA|mmetsp:Transcript_15894/g.32867  ORF Transcript_15894/g.32867 Transcript_15894/m.32867 type:complete len:288 (+) Transcript_15894:78-941(+)|eukprot:CAMPEP_0172442578 /NCGR_PEP_ID=MMETSP1065-20121228/2982_1 /TAXON_ID=265537 /ORGANISM="Amphiprora paludosa, Strain CCMP125" /LENGTH=287 /DNA_ID=CAMNT_0013192485 /DNA_START=218 /DNA_END=1081 /DNA_ORIENTATION=-